MQQKFLKAFGVEIQSDPPGASLETIDFDELQNLILQHRVCVMRGFQETKEEGVLAFCRQFGKIRQWEYGEVIDLKERENSQTHLFTNRAVRFHWDGAFASVTAQYIFFQCLEAQKVGTGGETIFCDASKILQNVSEEKKNLWKNVLLTYKPGTVEHEGFSSPMIIQHPVRKEPVLRFAEPFEDLNPVRLKVNGFTEEKTREMVEEMRSFLYDPACWYVHSWKRGDFLIADNNALLHARKSFAPGTPRHLRKINIL